jgi:hypothetical protein
VTSGIKGGRFTLWQAFACPLSTLPRTPLYFIFLDVPSKFFAMMLNEMLDVDAQSHRLGVMSTVAVESDAEKFRGMARLLDFKYTEAMGTELQKV